MGFRVQGSEFRVQALRFKVWGSKIRAQGYRLVVEDSGVPKVFGVKVYPLRSRLTRLKESHSCGRPGVPSGAHYTAPSCTP